MNGSLVALFTRVERRVKARIENEAEARTRRERRKVTQAEVVREALDAHFDRRGKRA
jgi:hypothetical protein